MATDTNANTVWDYSAVFVEQLEASQNSNGISNFVDQYKLLRTRRPPPLFSASQANSVLTVFLTIAQDRARFSTVSDLALKAIETVIWIIEEQKEQSFIDALRSSIFSEKQDGKLLILLQSALSDFITSRWNSRASALGLHLARLLNTNFSEFFKEMGKYVPNKSAQYSIQKNLENTTNIEDKSNGDVQSMEDSENQTMETDINSNGTNIIEMVTPVPSAPPLEQISSHVWELQEMQEVQMKVLQLLSKLVNVVTICKQNMYEEVATCDSWLEVIDDQQFNVEEFQVSMLCIGSMNSGKSTCLAAISGTNVFPISDAAMTTIPSFVRCDLNQAEPIMTCKMDAFKTAIEKLKPEIFARKEQNKLRELELASKDVLDTFFGQGDLSLDLKEQVVGEVQIEKQLRVLNHLVRLCTLLGVPNPVLDIKDIKDYPTITACFPIMRNMPNFPGKLTLIDSPGPDEQKMTQLKGVVNQLLKKATVKILVMDWQVLQGSANANIQAMVRESSNEIIGNKLTYVLVTKCDLMEEKRKSQPEEIKQGISQGIFGGEIPPERIFLVSARYGRHANMAKNFLLKNNRIPNVTDGEWVPGLMKDMFGFAWERVLRSLSEREFQEEVDALFQRSNLIQPIEMVLQASFQQAVPNSLFFAVNKIAMISKPLMEDLQIQYKSKDLPDVKLLEYVEKISSRMKALAELMPLLTMKKQDSFKQLSEHLQFQFKQATGEVLTFVQLFKENSSDILLEKIGATTEQKEIAYKLLRNNSFYLFESPQHAYESLMTIGIAFSKFVTNTIQQELSRNQDKWKSVSQELLQFIKNKINQELEGDAEDLNELFDTGLQFQIPPFSRPNLDLDDIKFFVRTVEKYELKYPWYFLFLLPIKERVLEKRVEITAKDFQLRIKEVIDNTIEICQDTVNRYIQIYFDTEIQAILSYIDSRLAQVRQSLETALNSKIKENENQKMERARTLDFLIGELTEIKQRTKDIQRVIEHPEEIRSDGKMEDSTNSQREKRKIDDQ